MTAFMNFLVSIGVGKLTVIILGMIFILCILLTRL